MMPSRSMWGEFSMMYRSLEVPGSDSSALTTTYLGPGASRLMKLHLTPVANPAPPRPRRPEVFTSLTSSEEHTSEIQSHVKLVCRLLVEKKDYFAAGRHSPAMARTRIHSRPRRPGA